MSDHEYSENALIVHLNEHGMVLHVECLGRADTFIPIAQCLGRTISNLLGKEVGENLKQTIKLALKAGPSDSSYFFDYESEGARFHSRITYLSPGIVLAVIVNARENHFEPIC